MRLVNVKTLTKRVEIAQTVYNKNGIILIQKGTTLSGKTINRLACLGINYVYIKDELTKDIEINNVVPSELKVEAIQTIKKTFNDFGASDFDKKVYLTNSKEENLISVIDRILHEIDLKDEALSLLSDIIITDNDTFQHSVNVSMYALAIGKRLKLTEKELSHIGLGAVLHDIGKVFIDPSILQKKDKLTDDEYEKIKKHTVYGFEYIRKQTDLSAVIAHCVYQHHERIDGTGYPRGLTDKEIHSYAKVIAVADVFDALTRNRPYRDALLPHEALEILYAGAVDQFDTDMVQAFKKSVVVYPNGVTVKLSNGLEGVVIKQNIHFCDRPVIRIISKDEVLSEINLAYEHNIVITECYAN